MYVNSEIREAQIEQLASDPTSLVKGRIWSQGTAPIKVFDGTQTHKVLTDKMYADIKSANFPDGITSLDLSPDFQVQNTGVVYNYNLTSTVNQNIISSSYVDVPGLSTTITVATSNGRPVEAFLAGGTLDVYATNSLSCNVSFRLMRGTDVVGISKVGSASVFSVDSPSTTISSLEPIVVPGSCGVSIPSSIIRFIDVPPGAGTYTYKIQVRSETLGNDSGVNIQSTRLYVKEF
jgi:hypothetical protein